MNLNSIREAIGNILEPLDIRVYPAVPDNPLVPCVIVYPLPFDYNFTFDPQHEITVALWCIAGNAMNMTAAQQVLDDWVSTGTDTSIYDLIHAASTLEGTVSSAHLRRCDSYTASELMPGSGARYLHATLLLDVIV